MWAYPREFTDASTAAQVTGSPHRFTTVSGISHMFLLTQGLRDSRRPEDADHASVWNTDSRAEYPCDDIRVVGGLAGAEMLNWFDKYVKNAGPRTTD